MNLTEHVLAYLCAGIIIGFAFGMFVWWVFRPMHVIDGNPWDWDDFVKRDESLRNLPANKDEVNVGRR